MKKRKMMDFMGLAEERFISEADPSRPIRYKSRGFNITAIIATACCFLLILNIILIIPLLTKEKDETGPAQNSTFSPSLGDMNQIQNPNGQGGGSNNNQDISHLTGNDEIKLLLDSIHKGNGVISDASDAVENEKDEVTDELDKPSSSPDLNDNQVENVSEGDLAKRSDKFLYYLSGTDLYVYSINKSNSKLEAMYPLLGYIKDAQEYMDSLDEEKDKVDEYVQSNQAYAAGWQMFLSPDYKTLTLIISQKNVDATLVITFGVSDAFIKLKDSKIFSGKYVSARMVDSEILLFTKYTIYKGYNKDNPLSYMPFYTSYQNVQLSQNIYFPKDASSASYMMVSRLEDYGLTVSESCSFLSYTSDIYVSQNNIYLTRKILSKSSHTDLDESSVSPCKTEISIIGYSSPLFRNLGRITVDGYVKDQYSLDEHQGILRLATTTAVNTGTEENPIYQSSASLYCIDIDAMEIIARVDNFAPLGETVRSVRFDGDFAYVCTAIEFTDPVFFFDMTSLPQITFSDTGVIDGYSTSLIQLGEGYVVGIGYGANTSVFRISVYKEVENGVEIVVFYEIEDTYASLIYKSYFIDRDRNLIGIPIATLSNGKYVSRYILFHFNGEILDIILDVTTLSIISGATRSFYQDNYFYIVTEKDLSVHNIGNLDRFLPVAPTPSTGNTTGTEEETVIRDPSKPAWP